MAIALGNVTDCPLASASSFTVAHDNGTGNNRHIVYGGHYRTAGVPTVTYAAVTMTEVGHHDQETATRNQAIWRSANGSEPATGSNNLVCTASGATTLFGTVASYTGVNTTTPLDSSSFTGNLAASTSFTSTLTIVNANSWMMIFPRDTTGTVSASTGSTFRGVETNPAYFDSNGPLASGSNSMIVTTAVAGDWVELSYAFQPAAATAHFLSLLGAGA